MNYLAFQPAFDVFHTEFRILRLRRLMSADLPWHYDHLRIADFYLIFFFRLKDVRLSPKHRWIKKFAQSLSEGRYENQPDDQLLFSRMSQIQRAATETLVSKRYFDYEHFRGEILVESGLSEPDSLAKRIEKINEDESRILEAIQVLVTEYALLGPDGIKARTGLLEYQYDAI